MKNVILTGLFLLSSTEIRADLSDKPNKIQSLVKKLFNLNPNPAIVRDLAKPVKLETGEKREDVSSQEIRTTGDEFAYYNFKNITVTRNGAQKQNSQYTQLICDFHQQLIISQSIDPPNLEIKGVYNTEKNSQNQPSQPFLVKQFDGRITYKTTFNETNITDFLYNSQELKFGESSYKHISIIRAIGQVVEKINNKTATEVNKRTNLRNKIDDFKSVFPFILGSLSPINKTALKSQSENNYSISNTISEQWLNMNWTLSYVEIRGLNNFKQVKITVTDESADGLRVRFNITLITNKLAGDFEWQYSNNGHLVSSSRNESFTIDNLTLTADTRFEKNWIVDKVDIDLGRLNIQKVKEDELCDINVFAYDIFHENLQTLIKRHMKELLHSEYPQPTTSTHASANTTTQTTVDIFNLRENQDKRYLTDFLNTTTKAATNSTICIDDRRWWQKIYKRNKCKGLKNSEATTTPTPKTAEIKKCVDSRWWFQKPFIRNKCKPQVEIKLDAV